jgi:hypothetical protein
MDDTPVAPSLAGRVALLCAQLVRWVWRAIQRGWQIYGGSNLLLNLMALCVAGCCGLLMWWAVFEPLAPLTEAEILSPARGTVVVNRDETDEFLLTRRVCMRHGAWGRVSRLFVGAGGVGLEYRIAAKESVFLPAGCHVRSRMAEVPQTLPPGVYRFRSSVEFCNRLRCEDAWTSDVLVTVTGHWPLTSSMPPEHFREPF